jgi:hypothetical protein
LHHWASDFDVSEERIASILKGEVDQEGFTLENKGNTFHQNDNHPPHDAASHPRRPEPLDKRNTLENRSNVNSCQTSTVSDRLGFCQCAKNKY